MKSSRKDNLPYTPTYDREKIVDESRVKNFYRQMHMQKMSFGGEDIDQKTLIQIMGTAEALIYPSLYEGFGLPVLEAMACGTPVITSKSSPMEEIIKDAGLKISPLHIEELSNAMNQLIQNTTLQKTLVTKGLEYAKNYTWDQAADGVAKIIESQFN
ncbi:MAG: glycosyltransferase [Chitinophagales bacterium]|nr:glycosyltransferase [Chitinophagales bacterium]